MKIKNPQFFMLVVMVLMSVTVMSCSKVDDGVYGQPVTIKVVASSNVGTKTHYDGIRQDNHLIRIRWDQQGESLCLIERSDRGVVKDFQSQEAKVSPDGLTAVFTTTASFTFFTPFDYWGISPYGNAVKGTDLERYVLSVPSIQHPLETSFDPHADLLISQKVSDGGIFENVRTLNMRFTRAVALVEMTLLGMGPDEILQSVSFSTGTAALAGQLSFNLMTGKVLEYGLASDRTNTVTCNYTGYRTKKEGNTIYFNTFPTGNLSDFTVTAVTDKNTYTKVISDTGGLSFRRNVLLHFSLDFKKEGWDGAYIVDPGGNMIF